MRIDAALVAGLVAAQFPRWADLPVRPVELDGWDNRSFRLGADKVVRLPSGPAYAAQVAKEQRWLPVLAPRLPLPIPQPLALGAPAHGYPWQWSVYRWLDGEPAETARIDDQHAFARDLAGFLVALQRADATGGPPPGEHNFLRGAPPAAYDAQTLDAMAVLGDRIDAGAAALAWREALSSRWERSPVWLHGDVAPANLLVRDGRLAAVIDFGCAAVGDPACDLAIAWTLLTGDARETFRRDLAVDDGTWARGHGWTLWKSLIILAGSVRTGKPPDRRAVRALQALLGTGAVDSEWAILGSNQ